MPDSTRAVFVVNDRVRMKSAVTDFDYADMPLAGGVGTVMEGQEDAGIMCLVQWSPETLRASPVVNEIKVD